MHIKFRWILSAVVGLTFVSMAESLLAAPAGLPQQMLPSYVPASPSRGIASFRPHYRFQQMRPMTRPAHPVNLPPHYAPVRRAAAWPIPVSYRPIVPMPRPRLLPPYGYRGQVPPWLGYSPRPAGRYGMPPMPHVANAYPMRPPVGRWAYPRPPQFRGPRAYPPIAPVGYRQTDRRGPWGGMRPMPYTGYPGSRPFQRPVMPAPRALPWQSAGRYQPYSGLPGGRQDYRFRSIPLPMALQGNPVAKVYPISPAYPRDYRFRQDQRHHPLAGMPARQLSDRAWQARPYSGSDTARPIRREEWLAWDNTAPQFRRTGY